MNPVLLGGNIGVNNFDGLGTTQNGISGVTNSLFTGATQSEIICLIYQIATDSVPSSLQTGLGSLPLSVVTFAATHLNGLDAFINAGCPLTPIPA